MALSEQAMFYGVVEIALAFEVKHLPQRFDELSTAVSHGGDGARRLEKTSA